MCRPSEQNQDSEKRERITFVRSQFRLPPRSSISGNPDLTLNCLESDLPTTAYATTTTAGTY